MTSCSGTIVILFIVLGIATIIAASHKPVKYQKTYRGMAHRGSSRDLHIRGGHDQTSHNQYPDYDWTYECEGKFMCGMMGYGYYRHVQCIDMLMVCNGRRDCQTGMDEKNCPTDCHKIGKMQCSDGMTCGHKCDGKKDCPAGDDEKDCPFTCGPGMYLCKGSRQWCITGDKFCNGVNDCPDYEDESNCPSTCEPGEYKCTDGKCIDKSKVCDGNPNDCSGNNDEDHCSTTCQNCPPTCSGNQFKCPDGKCIDGNKVCDNVNDCTPNVDESLCPPPCPTCTQDCPAGQYMCLDGTCVPRNKVCDGVDNDCQANDDESMCSSCPTCPPPCPTCPPSCPPNSCKCSSGECIDFNEICDDNNDCTPNDDEMGCPTTCERGEYWCSSSPEGSPICITEEDACETSVDNCPEASETGALCT